MIELTANCFNEICNDPPVREQLGSLEANRSAAVRRFWTWFILSILLAAAAGVSLFRAGWEGVAFFVPILLVVFGGIISFTALAKVSHGLKKPVLEALAAKAGMEYLENGFSPPAYPEACKALFGGWLSEQKFTDLFHGKDEEGRNLAVYEAHLERGSGKNRHTVFQGQIYAIERRGGTGATTLIVPDHGIFNFLKPSGGVERVKLESDPDFEKKFEVYGTSEMEARQHLFDTGFRQRLLEMRQKGRVFVYVGPEDALVAASGGNRFEPGSMLRSKPGDERVRSMVNDLCDALATLRALKAKLG
jgi:hypothetical protein